MAGQDNDKDGKLWNIPYPQNHNFVGREAVVAEIRRRLTESNAAVVGQAIRGLGGIGKTETAVAYAYQYRDEYQAVFWVRSETEQEIQQGYYEIHNRLWPSVSARKAEDVNRQVLRWLSENGNWLIIFDNADTPGLIKPFLPPNHKGHVLLTSRSNTFRVLGIREPIELPPLDREAAIRFLLESTCRENVDADEREAAGKIADKLGRLPLALEQAAAFIEQGASFQDYLTSLNSRVIPWLEGGTAESRGYPNSVATTWQLNFQAVAEESPASADLLRFSAFLGPDEIPFELISKARKKLGPEISEALKDAEDEPLKLIEILNPLSKYSLISIDAQNRVFSIHRLVQKVTEHSLTEEACREWKEKTVLAFDISFPDPEFSNWRQCERLLSHAEVVMNHIRSFGLETREAASACNRIGVFLYFQGRYTEAEPVCKQAMLINGKKLGEDHSDFATCLNNLAELYRSMGRYVEAEPLYKQSIEIRRHAHGGDDSSFATNLNNLALLYVAKGNLAEAEPLYEQAVEIHRKKLDEYHPGFADCLNNLAGLHRRMGNYSKAESLYREALENHRQSLGESHPSFAVCLNNLAELFRLKCKYMEAEPLYKQSLDVCRNSLGENHPSYATCLNNLAELYRLTARHSNAEPLYEEAMEIYDNAFGKGHPKYANCLNNLALLYCATGFFSKAEPLFQQSIEIMERAVGAEHPDTKIVKRNYGSFLKDWENIERKPSPKSTE